MDRMETQKTENQIIFDKLICTLVLNFDQIVFNKLICTLVLNFVLLIKYFLIN